MKRYLKFKKWSRIAFNRLPRSVIAGRLYRSGKIPFSAAYRIHRKYRRAFYNTLRFQPPAPKDD